MIGRSARATLVVAGVVSSAVIGAACSGSAGSSAATTVLATATTYATVPLRGTTTTQATVVGDNGAGASDQPAALDRSVEQPYDIRSGDYILSIANDFDVPYQNLIEYNGWADGVSHALVPGQTIRIPPSNYDPNASAATAGSAAPASTNAASQAQCPDGSAQQIYTIQSGDVKFRVAGRLSTTVSDLDAANVDTPHYGAFVVGIDILVPC